MTLADLVKEVGIDWTKVYVHLEGVTSDGADFDINPTDFLKFANQDFKNKDERGLVNAISNAKRAIDCQVDKFLAYFGYPINNKLPQNVNEYIVRHPVSDMNPGIKQQLKLLRALDAAPLSLVTKIRSMRNLSEHEYKPPTVAQVSEAIEIAELFIGSLDNVINTFDCYFHIYDAEHMPEKEGRLSATRLSIDYSDDQFEITAKVKWQEVGKVQIKNTEKQFLELVRLGINMRPGRDPEDALFELLQTINCDIPQNKIKVKIRP